MRGSLSRKRTRETEREWLSDGGDAGAQVRAKDWSTTPLGARDTWPSALRITIQVSLASGAPMALFVGPERVFFCNDSFRALVVDAPAIGVERPGGFSDDAVERVLSHGETVCVGVRSYSPMYDEQGGVVGVLVTTLNTPWIDEPLTEPTALFSAIIDSSPDVIFAKDREGRMRYANPATLDLIGKRFEDVVGKTDVEFLGDEAAARQVMENDRAIMESGSGTKVEENVPRPDGAPRVWLSRKVPYRDSAGNVVGLLGISTDITERKRADAALRESEERFRSVVENMSEGLMIFDPDGNLIYQNPASLRIHGFDPSNDGRMAHAQVPETWEAWDEHGRKIAFDEWPVSRVFRHESFSGQVLHVRRIETSREFYGSYNGSPVCDANGKLTVGFITIRDLSQEVEAQAAQRQSEDIARASLDAAQLGTWRRDLRTNEVVFDARAAQHFGFPSGRTTLEQVFERVHPDDRPRLRAAVAETVNPTGSGSYALEYRIITPEGAIRWLSVQSRVRSEGDGEHRRAVAGFGTSKDITHRKAAEQALQDANARLREADQRKNEFLAVLSHELRNPLAPIRTSVYLLEHVAPGSEQALRALAVIDRQTGQLARLIDDLLDVTRIGRGKINLQRELVDLASLAREVIEDHRDAFAKSEVELALQLPGEPVWVDGDPARLAQVIGNLLSNSVKFTQRGGRTVVAIDATAASARIRVRDNGVGMSVDTLEHIFEPFVQAVQTIARTRGGLGLGLALVKGLVELHGGSVAASSAGEGQGTELTVSLPLVVQRRATPASHVSSPAAPAKGLRILIVEDNVDAADMLKEGLELAHHEVVDVAHDGRAGVEAARQHKPDVVLCDLGLPELDGFGVARAIRTDEDPRLRSAFVVALSGYALSDDIAKARSAGFDEHLAKPATIERLTKLLAEVHRRGGVS